jgi:hypothetical protein
MGRGLDLNQHKVKASIVGALSSSARSSRIDVRMPPLDNGQPSRKPLPRSGIVALLCATVLTLCACGDSDARTDAPNEIDVSEALAAGDQDAITVSGFLCGAMNPTAASPMYLSGKISTDARPCPEPRLIVRGESLFTFDTVRSCVPDTYLIERGDVSHDLAMRHKRESA